MYINILKNTLNNNSVSFVKISLNTFKGVRNTLKNVSNFLNIKIITNKNLFGSSIAYSKNNFQNLFERDVLKNYSKILNKAKTNIKFVFYINNIIYKNTINNIQYNFKSISNVLKHININ